MSKKHSTKKPTYNYVKSCFEQKGYTLLSKEYINNRTKLQYVCPRGHNHSITWHSFNNGCICRLCYEEDVSGENHYNWKGGARINNLPLYVTYAAQLEKYQQVYKIVQDDLDLLGVECVYCKRIFVPMLYNVQNRIAAIKHTLRGDANFYCSDTCKESCPIYGRSKNYKNEENKNIRSDQTSWASLVKERDSYTCQKCGKQEDIMYAHHIDPVINNPVESMDIDNGVTLCKHCHKIVHQNTGCSLSELKC